MWTDNYRHIRFSLDDGVLTVAFHRPQKLNAVDAALHTEMANLWPDVARDGRVRSVLLTGHGRAFCSGGDIDWFSAMTPDALDLLFDEARQIVLAMLEVPQPIVAAVNGRAMGLGATLALLSDVIYAAEDAVLADTHVLAGIAAGDGGAVIWPWLCGMARAKEYLMTGDPVSAREAERLGLVNHVVGPEDLLSRAAGMARRLAQGHQMAIRATKFVLNKHLRAAANLTLDTSLALERACFGTGAHRDAVAGFQSRRQHAVVETQR